MLGVTVFVNAFVLVLVAVVLSLLCFLVLRRVSVERIVLNPG